MKAEPEDVLQLLQQQGHLRDLQRPKARLKKASLAGVDLSNARLTGADLSNADLVGANLSGADLSGANLTGANLEQARLEQADLRKARLRGANLTGARLSGAQLARAIFSEAQLSSADFEKADLSDADMSGLELSAASFKDATLKRLNLSAATLKGVDLSGANLEEGFLERAVFEDCNLERSDLTRANLVGFVLRRPTAMTGARLCEADLAEARLETASFEGVDLTGTIFDQAVFEAVSFEGATLTRADFQGVTGLNELQIQAIRGAGGIVNAVFFEKVFAFIRERRWAKIAMGIVALALAGTGLFYYQNPAYRPIDSLLEQAQALRNDGKPAEALEIYNRLLERVKDRLDQEISVLYEKAETLTELERPEEAAAVYAIISERTSNDRDETINAELRRAAALSEAGEYEKAIEVYRAIAEDATNSPKDVGRALVQLSQTYQKMGFEDRALEIFQETLKRFPHDPEIAFEVNLQMADMYVQRRLYTQAQQLLDQLDPLARDDSQRVSLLILRARLYEEMGDKDKSLATFEELVKRYPESPDVAPDVKMDLAQLMVDKGEYNWATRIYKNILEHSDDLLLKSQAQIAYGILLRQLGQTDKALELFQTVRRQAKDNPELQGSSRLEEADTLAALKRYDEALALLDEAIGSSDPGMAGSALLRRGQILLEMGRTEDAEAVFQQVKDRFGSKGEVSSSAQMELAQLEAAQGQGAQAVALYEQLLKDPAAAELRPHVLSQLGQAYADLDRVADAQRIFDELLTVKDDSEAVANGRFGLARLAVRQGDRAKAAALYRQVADEVDDLNLKVTALDTLARLYAEGGEMAAAIGTFQSILDSVPSRHDAAYAARQGMAEMFEQRREFDKAEKLYRAIIGDAERAEVAADARLALGRMYLDKGDPGPAISTFQEVLQKDANVPEAPFRAKMGLGEAYKAKGETEKAIATYRALAEDAPDPKVANQALDALSQLYQDSGRADEALKISQKMLQQAGTDPESLLTARLGIAASLRQKGEYQKALEMYTGLRSATSDRNLRMTVLDALGQTYEAMGKHDEAAATYEELVRDFQDNQDILHNAMMGLATARRGQKRPAEAIALYQKIVDETPDKGMKSWALESIAQAWNEAGQPEKAAEAYKKVNQDGPAGGDKLSQANSLRSRHDLEGALKLYGEVANEDPDTANRAWALVYAGQVLSEQEKNDEALERYLLVIEKYPKEAEPALTAKLGVAGIYRARNRLKEATGRYEELSRGESFPDYRVSAALTAAELYVEQDQRAKAKSLYEQVLSRFPDRAEGVQGAKLGLARLARDSGQAKEALAQFQQVEAAAADPSLKGAALAGVARCYADLGQKDKARETWQAVKTRYPDQAELVTEADAFLSRR